MKKILFLTLKVPILFLFFCNNASAQNASCSCQAITTNISFINTHDIECAIMRRVNCLINNANPVKCIATKLVSQPGDGLVTYQDSNGTVLPYSQDLYNALIVGIFNDQCGNTPPPVTPAKIQAIANVIYARIMSQPPSAPNKISRIKNLNMIYLGLCDTCPIGYDEACAYEFNWHVDIVKCSKVDIPSDK